MQDQSPDFEKLRHLLALKRHENPPPGYFRDFSRRVLTQLETEEARERQSWLGRLTELFQTRPAISWSFCMATGLVVIAATTLFENGQVDTSADSLSVRPVAAMTDQPAAPAAGAFLVTNLEPRQFALEITPPAATPFPSNSLFSIPFYQRMDADVEFRGRPLPASFQTSKQP